LDKNFVWYPSIKDATSVKRKLSESRDRLLLSVADNGTGIAQNQINRPTSTGLTSMRERILEVEGEFVIEGIDGKGTTVSVSVPLG